MKKKQLMATLLSAGMILSSLAGSAQANESTATTEAEGSAADASETEASATKSDVSSDEEVEIELFHQKPENVELYQTIVNEFMDENPNIKVNITLAESTTTTLISRISSGDIPNLVSIYPWNASYKDMMAEGLFVDLTGEKFLDRVNQNVLAQCEYEGANYSLPLTVNAYGLYYNVDIFNELGLEPPKTLDELWEVCEKLKAAGYQAFSFPDKKATRINQMFDRVLGGSVDHEFASKCDDLIAGTYSITEDPNMRTYADAIIKIREYGNADSLGYDDEPAYEEFTSGKAAMYIDGTWAVTTFESMNPDLNFNCTSIPTITADEFYTSGSIDTAFAISSDSSDAQVEACKKFLSFLVREDIAQEFCDGDKNPNLVEGVSYSVPQLEEINNLIADGKFVASLARVWTQDLRNNIVPEVQALILDKDVDTFLQNVEDLILEYYTPQE